MSAVKPPPASLRRSFVRTRAASPAVAIVGVAVLFGLLYAGLALYQPLPIVFPDEFIYGHLARSLASGGGFSWRGAPVGLHAAGYVLAITPAWVIASGASAYEIAKVEGALLCCLTALPVWYLARDVLERRLAICAVALSLSGTWMVTTSGLLTENVALPLAVGAFAATTVAIRHPGHRAGWAAVGLVLFAAYCRMQLVVLLPALAAAFVLDALLARDVERLKLHRVPLTAFAAATVIGLLVELVDGHVVGGIYSDVLHYHPPAGRIVGKSALQLAQLAAMSGFAPLFVVAGGLLHRSAWRDPRMRPLLVVFVPVVVALVLESGFFLAANAPWGIERYVEYAAPLTIVLALAFIARPAMSTPRSFLLPLGLALALLLLPKLGNATEERAVSATFVRVRAILGSPSVPVALMVGALVAGGLVAGMTLLARKRLSPAVAPLVAAAALFLVLVAQSTTAWSLQLDLSRSWRTAFPPDLQWVDHHATGPVGVLAVTQNALEFEDYDFFNTRIKAFYAPPGPLPGRPVEGRVCEWQVGTGGRIVFDRQCGPPPRSFLVDDPAALLRFRNETASAADPRVGRLVTVAGTPQLLGFVAPPCNRPRVRFVPPLERMVPASAPAACADVLIADLWLDQPAVFNVTFRGGATVHEVVMNSQTYRLAPHRLMTISLHLQPGTATLQYQLDWDRRSKVDPAFVGARLETPGRIVRFQ